MHLFDSYFYFSGVNTVSCHRRKRDSIVSCLRSSWYSFSHTSCGSGVKVLIRQTISTSLALRSRDRNTRISCGGRTVSQKEHRLGLETWTRYLTFEGVNIPQYNGDNACLMVSSLWLNKNTTVTCIVLSIIHWSNEQIGPLHSQAIFKA